MSQRQSFKIGFRFHGRDKRDPDERFWEKVEKTDYCWNWLGVKNDAGYGQIHISGQLVYAHRYSYELLRGPIPEGLEPDHLCRNHSCVRPDHLELNMNEFMRYHNHAM